MTCPPWEHITWACEVRMRGTCAGLLLRKKVQISIGHSKWCGFSMGRAGKSAVGNVTVFIVDPHSIFRLGLATCLEELPLVGRVTGVGSVEAASRHADLATSDIVIVDASAADALAFIRDVRGAGTARLIACASSWQQKDILATMEAGAVCVLRKDTLTP